MRKESDYAPVVEALTSVLHNLPGKIVSTDGLPGVGKTTLGRFLACRFNVSLIETDLYLIQGQGRMVYMNDEVGRIIARRVCEPSPRPVIVEGATILRLLDELKRPPDFAIYVTNEKAPENDGGLKEDLEKYEKEYSPRKRANLEIAIHYDD
jgi:hypothetical protein